MRPRQIEIAAVANTKGIPALLWAALIMSTCTGLASELTGHYLIVPDDPVSQELTFINGTLHTQEIGRPHYETTRWISEFNIGFKTIDYEIITKNTPPPPVSVMTEECGLSGFTSFSDDVHQAFDRSRAEQDEYESRLRNTKVLVRRIDYRPEDVEAGRVSFLFNATAFANGSCTVYFSNCQLGNIAASAWWMYLLVLSFSNAVCLHLALLPWTRSVRFLTTYRIVALAFSYGVVTYVGLAYFMILPVHFLRNKLSVDQRIVLVCVMGVVFISLLRSVLVVVRRVSGLTRLKVAVVFATALVLHMTVGALLHVAGTVIVIRSAWLLGLLA